MKCPNCGSINTTIIDTRNKKGQLIRKRLCNECNKVFLTTEVLNDDHRIFVIEPNFTKRGTFKRQKLFNSMIKAAYDSNLSVKEINNFIDNIEFGEIRDYTTEEIFEKTCEFLKEKDYRTYVRYAVKHKNFILEDGKE